MKTFACLFITCFKYCGRLPKNVEATCSFRLRRSLLGPRTFIFNHFTVDLDLEIT